MPSFTEMSAPVIAGIQHNGTVTDFGASGVEMQIVEGDPFNNDLLRLRREAFSNEQAAVQAGRVAKQGFISRLIGGPDISPVAPTEPVFQS